MPQAKGRFARERWIDPSAPSLGGREFKREATPEDPLVLAAYFAREALSDRDVDALETEFLPRVMTKFRRRR